MRLIDADALLSDIERTIVESGCVNHEGEIMDCVRYASEFDAVPVVRGKWIVDECDSTDDVPSRSWIDFHCSECNMDYGLEEGQYGWCRDERIPYNYCPSCGAKMEVKP